MGEVKEIEGSAVDTKELQRRAEGLENQLLQVHHIAANLSAGSPSPEGYQWIMRLTAPGSSG